MRCFEDKRNNPFQFRHLSLCHGLSDLARVPSPKVVLASQPDLECGFSRDLFIQWCQDPKNSIILTYRTTPGTLARFLIDNPSEKVTEIEVSTCIWTFFLWHWVQLILPVHMHEWGHPRKHGQHSCAISPKKTEASFPQLLSAAHSSSAKGGDPLLTELEFCLTWSHAGNHSCQKSAFLNIPPFLPFFCCVSWDLEVCSGCYRAPI